jgi:putative aldouronate transport system substrate-binding protein
LGKGLTDARNGILAGRAPVSSWKEAVTKWRNGGGDKIRAEYQQAFSEAGPK